MKASHLRVLKELLSLPTSPLNEHYIVAWIRRWAAARPGIELKFDAYGNLRLRIRRGKAGASPPLLFSAHMDHPGFEAERMLGPRRLRAIWRGGVDADYFPGSRVRFYRDGGWVRGVIRSVVVKTERGRKRVGSVVVEVPRAVPPKAIGMWDLPDPVVRGTRIHARGCDDLAGATAVICALDELYRWRGPVNVYATFTRAEEVGFVGAMVACRSGLVPERARIVAVECSSRLPGVELGDGPILRVGDLASVFTPGLTAFCRQVAEDVRRGDRRFVYQRRLMYGGTCESAVFCEYGYEATGLCLALGNYHNMDRSLGKIAAEYIDLRDFEHLVRWFVALGTSKRRSEKGDPSLRRALHRLDRQWSSQLLRTAASLRTLPG